MKLPSLVLLGALGAATAGATSTPYYTATFPGYNGSQFVVNGGAVTVTSSGLGGSQSISMISQTTPSVPPPGTTVYEYEVRTTYRLNQSGGNYVTYLRASNDAHLNTTGGASSGTFYATVLGNVVINGSACSATLTLYKGVSGVISTLSSTSVACFDGMVIRSLMRNPVLYVFKDQWDGCCLYGSDLSLTQGFPGVGVSNVPSGNGISRMELHYIDVQAPPQPNAPGMTPFADRVEMQWAGTADEPNGSGLYHFRIHRRQLLPTVSGWQYKGAVRSPNFTDATVADSSRYEYEIGIIQFSGKKQNVWNGQNSAFVTRFADAKGTVYTLGVDQYFARNKAAVGAIVTYTNWGPQMFLGYAFFDPSIAGVRSGYSAQAQALMIMHESIHLAGFGDAVFGGSKQLTSLLIDNCYPVIKQNLGGLTQ